VSPSQPATVIAFAIGTGRRARCSASFLIGASELIWESREDMPYDVAFEPGGTLLVATG
jgi:hypothetical protein